MTCSYSVRADRSGSDLSNLAGLKDLRLTIGHYYQTMTSIFTDDQNYDQKLCLKKQARLMTEATDPPAGAGPVVTVITAAHARW